MMIDSLVNSEYSKSMEKDEKTRRRGRPSIGPQITLRLSIEMQDAIAAVLQEGEDRAGFIRAAIERELKRRSRGGG